MIPQSKTTHVSVLGCSHNLQPQSTAPQGEVGSSPEVNTWSIAHGIEVQRDHIEKWARILNKKTLNLLRSKAEWHNNILEEGVHTGYDVWRGKLITEFVTELLNQKVESTAEESR